MAQIPGLVLPRLAAYQVRKAGGNDTLNFGDFPGIATGDVDQTVEIIYRPTATTGFQNPVSKGGDVGWYLENSASGAADVGILLANNGPYGTISITANTWYHLIFQYDATNSRVDSYWGSPPGWVLRTGASSTAVANLNSASGRDFLIGDSFWAAGNDADAVVVRVWNRLLHGGERLRLMGRRIPARVRIPGLVFHYDVGQSQFRELLTGTVLTTGGAPVYTKAVTPLVLPYLREVESGFYRRWGGAAAVGAQTATPIGVPTEERAGAVAAALTVTVVPVGVPSESSAGVASLAAVAVPAGVPSTEAAGVPAATSAATLVPSGVPSGSDAGAAAGAGAITSVPAGVGSDERGGAESLAVVLAPTGTTSGESAGAPSLTAATTAIPSGVPSEEIAGVTTATSGGVQTATPAGVPSGETAGVPTASLTVTIAPAGVPSETAAGTETLAAVVAPIGAGSDERAGAESTAVVLGPTGVPSDATGGPAAGSGAGTATPAGVRRGEYDRDDRRPLQSGPGRRPVGGARRGGDDHALDDGDADRRDYHRAGRGEYRRAHAGARGRADGGAGGRAGRPDRSGDAGARGRPLRRAGRRLCRGPRG